MKYSDDSNTFRIITIPNILGILRLGSIGIVVYLFHQKYYIFSMILFISAMLLDAADGWIARKFKQISTIGIFLDPTVDKIAIIVIMYELSRVTVMPWLISHLTLIRELIQSAIRSTGSIYGKTIGANWMGKTKFVLQCFICSWGLIQPVIISSNNSRYIAKLLFNISACAVLIISWIFMFYFVYINRKLFLLKKCSS